MNDNDGQCGENLDDLPMEGTVTYELPLKLVLNLDDEQVGAAFRELCATHRQRAVDDLIEILLAMFNTGGHGFGVLMRDLDLDTELEQLTKS